MRNVGWKAMAAKAVLTAMFMAGQARAEDVSYERHVKPILDGNCVECHHRGSRRVDLSAFPFTPRVPTDQETIVSAIIARVESRDERMPPGGRPILAPAQVATLRAWLEQGLAP